MTRKHPKPELMPHRPRAHYDDEIVISGIAGRFPESDNMNQLRDNLMSKCDLITDDGRRWKLDDAEIPERTGKINNVDRFDSAFFGVHFKQAHTMDPMGRMLLEHAYEAIIDAGVNPQQLRGTKTGVFIAGCISESEKTLIYDKLEVNGLSVPGCSRAMLANRISNWLGVNGPSYAVDSACSSSLVAMENAFRSIRIGYCDAALVGAANLCLHPYISLQYTRLGVLSPDGRCKTFDDAANGFARGEAATMIYLQKAKDAKRIYATYVYGKLNCDGFKEEGITFPSSVMQATLLKEFYDECGVSPSLVSYVETHGTGTRAGDPQEVNALDTVFCPGRTIPLKLGSVKSNFGHGEPAAGLCSIAKVLIAMESGAIPPNINYNRPREEIEALKDGRIQVVTEVTPWEGGYVGINSFGFGGANGHILLKSNAKNKINNGAPDDNLPRLVVASGRTLEAANCILDDVESRPVDAEHVRLIQDIHSEDIAGHIYRGYTIVGETVASEKPIREVRHFSGIRPPVWFIFSGMGSQWAGMGTEFLRLPVFAEAIKNCDAVLKPRNVDIYDILTNTDRSGLDNIFNCVVGIAAMQIGLVDLLKCVGIVPDKIIGHSVGQLGCGYADGSITAEETILAAYSRGLAVSGTDAKKKPKLAHLRQAVPHSKPRSSSKWIRAPAHRSESDATLEEHTNNLQNTVFLEEWIRLIPKDAVTIEIAPHGLLQGILRQSMHPEMTNVAVIRRGQRDNFRVLVQGLGRLFNAGLNPQVHKLYPEVSFPVGRGTRMIAPLVKWDHSDDWYVMTYKDQEKIDSGERSVKVTLANDEYKYMSGHVIDGRNLLPATGYLTLVWETLGMIRGEMYTKISVVFEDVKFLRATTMSKEGDVELSIMIQTGTGNFEIIEGDASVVTGIIRETSNPSSEMMGLGVSNEDEVDKETEEMSADDIYKELKLRGYNYSGMFRSVKSATLDATRGTIAWENNWAAFMDGMLQMSVLDVDSRELFIPTRIQKIVIDTEAHLDPFRDSTGEKSQLIAARLYKNHAAIVAGGIEIRGFRATAISRRKPAGEPILETYKFVAHRDDAEMTLENFVAIALHLSIENSFSLRVKTVEVVNESIDSEDSVTSHLVEIFQKIPLIQADVNIVAREDPSIGKSAASASIAVSFSQKLGDKMNATLASGRDLFATSNSETLEELLLALRDEGFLLALETGAKADIHDQAFNNSLDIVLEKRVGNATALLLRKRRASLDNTTIIRVTNDTFEWVPRVKSALKELTGSERLIRGPGRIVLFSEKDLDSGLLGLLKCLSQESGGEMLRGYLIQDEDAPRFSTENPLYAERLKLDLAVNVLRADRTWGSYRHSPLLEISEKPTHHGYASQLVRGNLSSLRWLEGPLRTTGDPGNLVRVAYAPINFRDVMLATGKIAIEVVAKSRQNQECPYGLEYSGVDYSGRRVMGLLESRGFSNLIVMDKLLAWTVPESWSLEDAATVPCVYATCYYALYFKGNMKKGDRVLIHAGSGGVGQAAITLALHEGCEVFTTVGTPDKRRFIRERFPQIAEDHIGNSRDTSFEQMITRQTGGRGVDIVLNSLAEEKLRASVRCLGTGGRFLEIGKFDLAANNPLGMETFLRGISFHGVLLERLIDAPAEKKRQVQLLVQRGLEDGSVVPLTRRVFQREDIESALRHMAAGKHIGKVLIEIHAEGESLDAPIMTIPRFHCSDEGSYVLVGGLGGFGMELADWLVIRGAKNLVVTSRTGVKDGYQAKRIALWRSYGIKVVVIAGKEVHKPEDAEHVLNTAAKLGPVDAIFNLTASLRDALMEKQTEADFEESFRGKAWGMEQLDRASRKLCPELRHFIAFSSIVSGRGNIGQTNYGMANSAMERICERRAADGLPGLAIQWGPIEGVGLLAGVREDTVICGTALQSVPSCLEQLDTFLEQDAPIVASTVLSGKRAAAPTNIVETVLGIMSLEDLRAVSVHSSLAELGMDSMMAIEIKQTLEREFHVFLSAQDIRDLDFSKILVISAKEAAKNERD